MGELGVWETSKIPQKQAVQKTRVHPRLDDGGGQITKADPASSPTAGRFIPSLLQSTDAIGVVTAGCVFVDRYEIISQIVYSGSKRANEKNQLNRREVIDPKNIHAGDTAPGIL